MRYMQVNSHINHFPNDGRPQPGWSLADHDRHVAAYPLVRLPYKETAVVVRQPGSGLSLPVENPLRGQWLKTIRLL